MAAAAIAALASSPSRMLDLAPRLPQPPRRASLSLAASRSALRAEPLATYVGFAAASSPPAPSDAHAAAVATASGGAQHAAHRAAAALLPAAMAHC